MVALSRHHRAQRMEEDGHLNLVLKAIRNVNQLIVREKGSRDTHPTFLRGPHRDTGYFSAWIALYDESGKYMTAASPDW